MNDARYCARWFFAAMVVFPALVWVFSGSGYLTMSAFGVPALSESAELNRGVWLGVGLALVFVLFALAVARWGAPGELWFVAAAWAVLQALRPMEALVFAYAGGDLLGGYAELAAIFARRFFEGSEFRSMPLYLAATSGYLAAAVLGCAAGARRRARPRLAADPHQR